jgi:D-alanyl-D-alanine carboxypeptidase
MQDQELFSQLGIPADYGQAPALPRYAEATELERVEVNIVGREQKLAPETARDWRRMKRAAEQDGVVLLIVSGFRSVAYQTELFRKKIAAGQCIEDILAVSAAPGFSEHHTGRAIDIATPGARPLTDDFATSDAFAWLGTHAGSYGFRMPYERGNAHGIAYEPWHWSQL